MFISADRQLVCLASSSKSKHLSTAAILQDSETHAHIYQVDRKLHCTLCVCVTGCCSQADDAAAGGG